MKTLYIKDIMQIIPHRQPFLFVDRVEVLETGKSGIGYKSVTINEPFFPGHFPDNPVMPGVLIIETMAQVGSVILLSMDSFKGSTAYFAGINKFRFKKKIQPGDQLKMEVEITKLRSKVGIGYGKAFISDGLAAEGEFMFAIEEKGEVK